MLMASVLSVLLGMLLRMGSVNLLILTVWLIMHKVNVLDVLMGIMPVLKVLADKIRSTVPELMLMVNVFSVWQDTSFKMAVVSNSPLSAKNTRNPPNSVLDASAISPS